MGSAKLRSRSIYKLDICLKKIKKLELKTELASMVHNRRKLMKKYKSSPNPIYLISQRRSNQPYPVDPRLELRCSLQKKKADYSGKF